METIITVDASSLKDKIKFFKISTYQSRGCGKTFTRMNWLKAYMESEMTGIPVQYEAGIKLISIDSYCKCNKYS